MMGDVKNMYTELKHTTIMEAVDWIIGRYKSITRRTELTVRRTGKQGVTSGRATNTASSVTISLDKIRDIVKMDLENAIFSVGDPERKSNIFRQILGVPT